MRGRRRRGENIGKGRGFCEVDIPDIPEPGKRKDSLLLYSLENILFK